MPPAQVRAIVGSTGFCEADGVLTGVPRSGRAGRYVLAMGAAEGHDVLDVRTRIHREPSPTWIDCAV